MNCQVGSDKNYVILGINDQAVGEAYGSRPINTPLVERFYPGLDYKCDCSRTATVPNAACIEGG